MLINSLIASFLIANSQLSPEFSTLKQRLEKYNFTVKIESPPVRSTYGLLEVKTRIIWIEPIVFDLGIALPTLIHEATHVAQLCGGNGEIKPLNLTISPPNISRPFFTHYNHGLRRHLEAEAYAIQTHPDGYNLVLSLLDKHCK